MVNEQWWVNPEFKFGRPLTEDFEETKDVGLVGVIMGSRSDWPYVAPACRTLEELEIPFEYGVVSAHRTPERMREYSASAYLRGLRVIIACAGGSAHLQGMSASETILPIFGITPKKVDIAAIYSMIEMPEGVPLAYLGGGSEPGRSAGAVNAALMAARVLSLHDADLRDRLLSYQSRLSGSVPYTCHD